MTAVISGLVLAALFLIPGLTWGPLMIPGARTSLDRLGRALGVGIIVGSLTTTVLATLGGLQPTVTLVVLTAVTLIPLLHTATRQELLYGLRRPRPVTILSLFGAVGLVVLLVAVSQARLNDAGLPATSTVWYYANLAQAMATQHGIPGSFMEWGTLRPFQSDYLPFTSHSAFAFQWLTGDIPIKLEAYRIAVLSAGFVIAAMLFRRWVPTWASLLAATLLLASMRLEWKFLGYKPETFGLVIALLVLWLIDRAVTERSARIAVMAAVGVAVVTLSHAEIVLVLMPAAAGIALARGLLRPRRGRLGLGIDFSRRAVAGTAIPALIVGAGVIGGIVTNGLIAGEFRLAGYLVGDRGPTATPASIPADWVPPGWSLSEDPTWDFHVVAVNRARVGEPPPQSLANPQLLSRENLHIWPIVDGTQPPGAAAVVILAVLPLLLWPWSGPRLRRMILTWAVFAAALLAGSFLLNELSATYVPRRIAGRRLMPYELFYPVMAVVLAAVLAADRGSRLSAVRRRRWGRPALVIAIVASVVGLGVLRPAGTLSVEDDELGISASGYDSLTWLRENTPPGSRILANAYTDGSLTMITERPAILDGRAVYLEDREFLVEATSLLLGGRRFFADPGDSGSLSYLRTVAPDFLLVSVGDGSELGGYRPFVTDIGQLDASPRFELVRTLADGRLRLYSVDWSAATSPYTPS